jgi:Tfp pilus assembly protein PilW
VTGLSLHHHQDPSENDSEEIMRKIIWALPLATVLATAIGIPSASAATGTIHPFGNATGTLSAIDRYSSADDTQTSSVSPMQVGDCTMYATLSVGRPNSNGLSKVTFSFDTLTSHTSKFDQWHNSWKFLDNTGRQIGAVNVVDGVQMKTVNHDYIDEINTSTPMNFTDWSRIATVTWTGSC